jgi:hypothetical protein
MLKLNANNSFTASNTVPDVRYSMRPRTLGAKSRANVASELLIYPSGSTPFSRSTRSLGDRHQMRDRLVVGGSCKTCALSGYFSHSLVDHLSSSSCAANFAFFTNCQVAASDRAARRSAAIRGCRRRRSAGAATAAAAWQWRSRPRCVPIGRPGSDGCRRRRTTA